MTKVIFKNGELHFTPTERRILTLLSDGMTHTKTEIRSCLNDDMALDAAVSSMLTSLREKLKTRGEWIVTEYDKRRALYRHVVLLPVLRPVDVSQNGV